MKLLAFVLSFLAATAVFADTPFNTFTNGLPAITTPVGTENVPCVSGTTSSKCTTQGIANTVALTGDVITAGGVATIQPSSVTLTKQANLAASSIQGNISGSAAAPQALSPLAVAVMGSYGMNAHLASTANVTLTGVQTIDGIVGLAGEPILLKNQTTTSQNGLWIMQVGAWTRPINFPSGYVLPTLCTVDVFVEAGNVNQGHTYNLATGGAITIDTTAQSWNSASYSLATATTAGLVKVTNNSNAVAPSIVGVTRAGDCVTFNDTAGSVTDQGNFNVNVDGTCVIADTNGHIASFPNSQGAPTISGTGCSLAANASDNSGAIVATGADTCTVTFIAAWDHVPFCAVAGYSATVLPFVSTAATTTAVIFKTAAAGTMSYVCM